LSNQITSGPGWYDDADGHTRWWNGERWGEVVAPASVPVTNDRGGAELGTETAVPAVAEDEPVDRKRRDLKVALGIAVGTIVILAAIAVFQRETSTKYVTAIQERFRLCGFDFSPPLNFEHASMVPNDAMFVRGTDDHPDRSSHFVRIPLESPTAASADQSSIILELIGSSEGSGWIILDVSDIRGLVPQQCLGDIALAEQG
jgi:hypothetical protein